MPSLLYIIRKLEEVEEASDYQARNVHSSALPPLQYVSSRVSVVHLAQPTLGWSLAASHCATRYRRPRMLQVDLGSPPSSNIACVGQALVAAPDTALQ
jgi:hypothetical protein